MRLRLLNLYDLGGFDEWIKRTPFADIIDTQKRLLGLICFPKSLTRSCLPTEALNEA